MPKDFNPIIGEADCTLCGSPVTVKATKNGHLYYFCFERGDCSRHFSAGDIGDEALAERIRKWRPGMKEKFAARDREEPADDHADPEPGSETEPASTPARPAPPRPSPPARRPRPRTQPSELKPKSWWDTII